MSTPKQPLTPLIALTPLGDEGAGACVGDVCEAPPADTAQG